MEEPLVIYIEDESFFAGTISRLLSDAGYPTETAGDGETGLAVIKAKKPALVLLDLLLPKMDGKELLKRLKADPETKDIPVIVLSNLGTDEDRKETADLGAVDYLVKAMTLPSSVVDTVREHLGPAPARVASA